MDQASPSSLQDFGVTHGLDFARWITEIANLLKRADASDPTVQVAFLEIAKSLERLRRYKRALTLGTYKTYLTVNESVVTSFPTAEIVASPMVRLMDAAGIWSIGVDHRIDIANVEMLATMLARPEEEPCKRADQAERTDDDDHIHGRHVLISSSCGGRRARPRGASISPPLSGGAHASDDAG